MPEIYVDENTETYLKMYCKRWNYVDYSDMIRTLIMEERKRKIGKNILKSIRVI